MSGPLDGVKVLDLSMFVAAPMATLLLAEQGADVIKVEPFGGESFRLAGTTRHGVGAWWASTNRNKRSLQLDLKTPQGRDIVHELARGADVLVHQLRIGVAERLGVGAEQMTRINPKLIYASLTGFGAVGPRASRRVYDNVIQAAAGINAVQGGRGEPQTIRTPIADKVTSVVFAQAITAALYERSRSGQGQIIETSMLHSMLWFMWPDMMHDDTFIDREGVVRGTGLRDYASVVFRTADGNLTAAAGTPEEFRAIAEGLERSDWLADPLIGDPAWRGQHPAEVADLLARELATRSTAEWERRFNATDAIFAAVVQPSELVDDVQVRENDMVAELDHPSIGRQWQPTHPARFSRTPTSVRSAPALGEHTRQLLDELGVDEAAQQELIAARVVKPAALA